MTTVVITGFMGTGKTSVGRALAERLSLPFVDSDTLVEQQEGRTVAEIFATDGESYFRSAEKRALATALAIPGAVVASGGGAIVDPDNLREMKAAAPVVCLTASAEVIERRTRAQGATRPLLAEPDPTARIAQLLEQRRDAYAQADLEIDTSNRGLEELVDEIAAYIETKQ